MSYPGNATHLVRGFAPTNQGGHLLLETWHIGDASVTVELAAWRARYARGEVGYVEVVDLQQHTTKFADLRPVPRKDV